MSETVATTVRPRSLHAEPVTGEQLLSIRSLFFVTSAIAAVVFLQFQFWKQPSIIDRANWDYFAQVIARGGVPYRDVVNIKAPLSAYIGAAAIIVAHPLGLRDVFAIRIVFLLLSALTVGLTFLVACRYFRSRRVALLSAAIMMAFNLFGDANSGGVQPKTAMILFGLISLLAIQKDRPLLAGVFGMLSALSWQPGLLFVGVAALAFSRYMTRWRDGRTIKLLAGAALPLVVFVGYFWLEGGLKDLYWWTIDYNLTVDAPRGLRTIPELVDRFARLLKGPLRSELPYVCLGVLGLAIACARELKSAVKAGTRNWLEAARDHAIIVAPLIYFAFCLINIQGAVDLIPLLPFIASVAAVAIVDLLNRAANVLARGGRRLRRSSFENGSFAVVLALILIIRFATGYSIKVDFPTLKDQETEVAEITSHLKPGDKIFTHGIAEILVLSGLTNASKHYFLDRGKDNYLDRVEPGGFSGWLEVLKDERPKIVAIERTKYVERKDELYDWVRSDYEEHKGRIFTYYVRKDSTAE